MSIEYVLARLSEHWAPDEIGAVVEDGDWVVNGKWETADTVIRIDPDMPEDEDGPFKPGYYRITMSRSGSYYTDYEYSDPYVEEVEPVTQTLTVITYRTKNSGT